MRVHSLSRRVLTIVLGAQLICAVLLSLFALLHERHTRLRAFDESLKGRSDSVLGAIQDAEDTDNNVMVDVRELKVPRGDSYAVYSYNGVLLDQIGDAPFKLTTQNADGFHDVQARGGPYRVYQRSGMRIIDRAETAGMGRERAVVILYASSKRQLQREILAAAGVYSSIILAAVLGTGVLVVLLVQQALRPLGDFVDAAAGVSVPALSFTIPASVMEIRELRPLAHVLDEVLGKLRDAFAKERRFLGDAAHELKTAVAIVRSTIQLLMLKPRTPAEYTLGLDRALEDVSRIESLVVQMLASSDSADESSLDRAPLSLGDKAAEVLNTLQSFALERQVELRLERAELPVMVRLREDRAAALISNLVLNAIQHSEPGMLVETRVTRGATGAGLLQVIDTGSGIAPSALPHVFERFYREDRSRSRETGGAGLGLAICSSIVAAAQGRIAIRSEPGSGTTVTVTLSAA